MSNRLAVGHLSITDHSRVGRLSLQLRLPVAADAAFAVTALTVMFGSRQQPAGWALFESP